jgi:hypothetical protein
MTAILIAGSRREMRHRVGKLAADFLHAIAEARPLQRAQVEDAFAPAEARA